MQSVIGNFKITSVFKYFTIDFFGLNYIAVYIHSILAGIFRFDLCYYISCINLIDKIQFMEINCSVIINLRLIGYCCAEIICKLSIISFNSLCTYCYYNWNKIKFLLYHFADIFFD